MCATRNNKNTNWKPGIVQNNNGKVWVNIVFRCLLRSSVLFCGINMIFLRGPNRPQVVLSWYVRVVHRHFVHFSFCPIRMFVWSLLTKYLCIRKCNTKHCKHCQYQSRSLGMIRRLLNPLPILPWNTQSRVLLEKLTVARLAKNFPILYGARRFITVFTRDLHWTISWASWIQSTSHTLFLKDQFLHSSHLRLRLPSGLWCSYWIILCLDNR
jgi:hypothetical protein